MLEIIFPTALQAPFDRALAVGVKFLLNVNIPLKYLNWLII